VANGVCVCVMCVHGLLIEVLQVPGTGIGTQ